MKKVCIVSIPRTGTNYLCSLLAQHVAIDSRYEIFHRKQPFSIKESELNDFFDELYLKSKPITNEEKASILIAHPIKFTNFLIKNSRNNILSYKIFPWHLDRNTLVKELLNDPDTVFLICKRKAIDSYISKEKASLVSTYRKVDTTNIKPEINFKDYKKWYNQRENWYQFIETALITSKSKSKVIYYEDFSRKDDTSNLNFVIKCIESLGIKLHTLNYAKTTFTKQDKNEDYAKKVENWEEFLNNVNKEGWQDKIESYFNMKKIK